MSAAWRSPTGMMTETSIFPLDESVMAGGASDEQVLGQDGELMLAQIPKLVDQLAQCARGEQHHGRGEEDHARTRDRERHPSLSRQGETRPAQSQGRGGEHG